MSKVVRRLRGHACEPFGLLLSSDGKIMVSTCDERKFRVWNTRTGKLIQVIDDVENPRQPVMVMDLSPDGRFLATGAPDYITKVFDTSHGNRLAVACR